ncbi:MAG: putative peptidoglycan glycosyltransferase FtsW [bacterium]|nr:putative peptidoglycan glycosyltransferase FtsW [bacterium]
MITKSFKQKPDKLLLAVSGILIVLGIIFLITVSTPYSLNKFNEPFYFFKHQLFYGLTFGLIFIFIIYKMDFKLIKKLSLYFFILSLFFVFLTVIPGLSDSWWGASRWINLGLFSFQPTEFLKVFFIIYFAAWLSERQKTKSWSDKKQIKEIFLPFLFLMGALSVLLYLQPDIGTLGVIVLTGLSMYFISGTPKYQAILLIVLGFIFLFSIIQAGYRSDRIAVLFNPDLDPMGAGYQMKQIRIAVGSGGLLGIEGDLSLGLSRQKFGFIPNPTSDSIFAIYAEEVGFVGCLFLIGLYLIFVFKGFLISKKLSKEDSFLSLAVFGITFWIGIQSFINIGAITGILPLTGIPLVFISYGSSSLLSSFIGLGILIKASSMIKS